MKRTLVLKNERGTLSLNQEQAAALVAFAEGDCITTCPGVEVIEQPEQVTKPPATPRVNPDRLNNGLYKLYIENPAGGEAYAILAAVGNSAAGNKWFAATNWIADSLIHPMVASTDWSRVVKAESVPLELPANSGEMQALQNKLQVQNVELNTVKGLLSAERCELSKLRAENEWLRRTNDQLKDQGAMERADYDQLRDKVIKQASDLADEKADNQKLRQRLMQLNSEINMGRVEGLVTERNNLQVELSACKAKLASQGEKLSATEVNLRAMDEKLRLANSTQMTIVVTNFGGIGVKVGNKVLFQTHKAMEVTSEKTDLQIRPLTDADTITLQRAAVNFMCTKWEFLK